MAEQWTLQSRRKEDQKRADNKRTAQPHKKGIHKWPEELIEMRRKRAETLNVFSEQVDRNVRPWQRKPHCNLTKQYKNAFKIFALQAQKVQIFVLSHSDHPISIRAEDM